MSEPPPMTLPSHEVLSRLARDDPRAFEALRCELIENRITRASEHIQPRLRRLQFRVDGIRRLSRSPLGATLKIYNLMWAYFLQMNENLQRLVCLTEEDAHLPATSMGGNSRSTRSARIIKLQPRSSIAAGRRIADAESVMR